MGAVKNSGVFKGVSVNGQIAKGLAKNGVVFWKQETLHPHTTRILARATAIVATPPTNIAQFDSFVRAMYPIWTEYHDLYAMFFADGNTNFKRINLVNPENVLFDFYGGFTLDSNGFKGNGLNAYVDTNFNPSLLVSGQKYQLNSASRGACVSVASTGVEAVRFIDLEESGSNAFANANNRFHRINNGTNVNNTPVDLSGTGFMLINRENSAGISLINKTVKSDRALASTAIVNGSQKLLGRASTTTNFSNGGLSSYFMGKSIPFDVFQQIRVIENNYRASLGLPQLA